MADEVGLALQPVLAKTVLVCVRSRGRPSQRRRRLRRRRLRPRERGRRHRQHRLGYLSEATGASSAALGRSAVASHANSVAIGRNAQTSAANTVSVGSAGDERRITNVAAGTSSTDAVNLAQLQAAVGSNSTFTEGSLLAPDSGPRAADASHPDGVALGPEAKGTGEAATAVGTRAEATGDEAVALGADAQASARRSTAVGTEARATHADSTAVGHGARTTRSGQMALGTAANTYTMPGITSSASRAAQSGTLEVVTSDRSGNLATDGGAIFCQLGDLREESRQGTAAAMAMTTAAMPSAAGRTSWAANLAAFRGKFAFGASLAHRFDTSKPLALTAGYAYGGGDSHGGRIGLAGEF